MTMKPELVGLGRVGCVMRFGEVAVKTANKWKVPNDASEYTVTMYLEINQTIEEALKHEGHVYQHLANVKGVLQPLQISDTEIRMPYIHHRSLDSFLRENQATVTNLQILRWVRNAADTLCEVHEHHVLVVDIAARNFLVNDDLSLQLCDFSESIIAPESDSFNEFISDDFLSVKTDIARFGSMVYEMVSGQRYGFYVNPEVETEVTEGESQLYNAWPTRERLPPTDDIFLGETIRNCWLQEGYGQMQAVCAAVHGEEARAT
ncbi:kinase-like domain-containing protein [Aspergillus ambiguus]|uniref:kinase-like domain-containing protein n=1 Tax=Aspergillus ambiguus TaxID=176160 RepID=UPI003CCD02A5